MGAGASGLMLATHLKNDNVCLIDTNAKVGAKIKVSGGAKCNITNNKVSSNNYLGENDFVSSVLKEFSNEDLIRFLKKQNLDFNLNEKIVKGTFFCNTSQDVIDMFSKLIKNKRVFFNTTVTDVKYEDFYKIKTNNKTIEAKKLVIASGGLSYQSLGASSIAFDIAKSFNHKISPLNPALVGFTVQKEQFWFKELSGISMFVKASVENKSFEGGLLFAHKGITGPVILNSSLYWKKGKMSIDFLPNKTFKSFLKGNKNISSSFNLPKRFMQEFLKSVQIDDKAISSLTKEELDKLEVLKNYEFAPAGNFGYTKAEVTKGGVEVEQIDVKTMESKIKKDLYFIGEALDVTGELGGFNFQFAFSSAYVCAKELNK
ncbi:NAD(P)/FAD-dependent oxidoreductase [Arcobacter sp.]|uniref:NAD(P)/FAD-dependent oxidoreductase n=1 Tax=unclassified Arcobacter TaxID=2593671 RepID=UPI003AFFD3A2